MDRSQVPFIASSWILNHQPSLRRLAHPPSLAAWVHWFLLEDRSIPECNDGGSIGTVWTRLEHTFGRPEWQHPARCADVLDTVLGDVALDPAIADPEDHLPILFLLVALYYKCQVVKRPDARETIADTVALAFHQWMDAKRQSYL
ncbi:hypothetical protein JTE90_010096 [Oedothorax gibbosus]|uniref:Uncharacterized protein n=1 Tax=Oedothorax gibbosus TaxID=931172 RepID=A0AAV6U5Y3_9ARAC|nr:hypothetical protein JTE90_010096 [Oedothorax gibbosus]